MGIDLSLIWKFYFITEYNQPRCIFDYNRCGYEEESKTIINFIPELIEYRKGVSVHLCPNGQKD